MQFFGVSNENKHKPLSEMETTNEVELKEVKMVETISNVGFESVGPTNAPVCLSWNGLTVSTKIRGKPNKYLLKAVSGNINGGLWAIMGSSGSGKTTFLSALAQRLDRQKMTQWGEIHLNGKPYSKSLLKSMSGYVMQDDLLNANFTVGETLSYCAQLRMSADTTAAERQERQEYVLRLMGIRSCKDVLVGDTRNKGISGGERKRLCIAMELLTRPKLLFLDEPTSGLDSATALSVFETLHSLSSRGECTIITSIHQPQTKIYDLFDNLILMRKGHMIYQGAAAQAVKFFDLAGFPCPPNTNYADHFIHVLSLRKPRPFDSEENSEGAMGSGGGNGGGGYYGGGDIESSSGREETNSSEYSRRVLASSVSGDYSPVNTSGGSGDSIRDRDGSSRRGEGESSKRSNSITIIPFSNTVEATKPTSTAPAYYQRKKFVVPVNLDLGSDKPEFQLKRTVPWYQQFWILLRRSLHSHIRRLDILGMNIAVTVLIAYFTCLSVWYHIGTHKASGSKRQPALFFCVIHQGIVASLQGSHSFPLERALMLRERSAGTYYISAYFLAKTVADMTVQLISPIIFSIIVYPMIGFADTSHQFFTFMGFMILDSNAATSLTNMLSCLCVGIELSTVVAAGAYEITRLYGGWFISPAQISNFPDWRFADALSYIKYAFVGVSLNENSNLLLTCLPSEMTTSVVNGVTVSKCVIAPLNKEPYTGAAYDAYYGYDRYTMSYCAGILILYIVCCRLIAYLSLRFIKV